jgi:hypothetical protein
MTMQTFLQEPLFGVTASQLDYRRLGKQRVEAMQIYNILAGNAKSNAWRTHPAVLMWKTYENALAHYYNCIRHEWIKRGYNNTMPQLLIEGDIVFPKWLGYKPFHDSHKSNLLRKFPEYYKQFNWGVPDNLPYIWPV